MIPRVPKRRGGLAVFVPVVPKFDVPRDAVTIKAPAVHCRRRWPVLMLPSLISRNIVSYLHGPRAIHSHRSADGNPGFRVSHQVAQGRVIARDRIAGLASDNGDGGQKDQR
ncbi:MAG: hypothetical protein JWN34_4238 [Bryobacterales bacterium]|nr:hypothetical protein [Bryobacterales bacterium]